MLKNVVIYISGSKKMFYFNDIQKLNMANQDWNA